MIKVLSRIMMTLIISLHGAGHALECPKSPEQVSKDTALKAGIAIGRLGPINVGSLSTDVNRTTQDLLVKLPAADRVYIEQMLFAAFCTSLQDDKGTSDAQKTRLLSEYVGELRRSLGSVSAAQSAAASKPVTQVPPPSACLMGRWEDQTCLPGLKDTLVDETRLRLYNRCVGKGARDEYTSVCCQHLTSELAKRFKDCGGQR